MKNIVVMISGNGSNLQAIIDAIDTGKINGRICAVISNKATAYGLERAKQAGISTFIFTKKDFSDNLAMDNAIAEQIEALQADLIVLAGYMKILTPEFTARFTGKILNIHPSLLPKYAGLNPHQRAMDAGDTEHGTTIHFVNEEVDGGAIILQAKVPIYPDDELDDVIERVYEQEHRCYPLVVQWFCDDRLKLVEGKAYLDNQLLSPQGYAIDD
ncbi:phosphoribosylglycinamide formyltransferase [Glaesserella parasuis]|uniref:phosphoribosylglycinamide formyltransferase n=1 Tax=Glaesserella parasuis TaxID=738 RepID=UPI0009926A37|nr:phosphoribosylglycinamide formyltransferase [Glaesserella parasuis]MDP0344625.1 phosphoribosylglycinamide formyltransferase [Glaesserella parasuis]MDP0383970.1 phosphoribosylglycinamide formyltransferase [Glaesserella parasuis]OOR92775.1 phosphoribosylglycinamide formyltransferase [Glaesserella parasuis]STO79582.1 phosphoribosylglycinamide formyltransferase [Glaesserella parasuis]